jgi:NAD(P)H-dependent FMN reductase
MTKLLIVIGSARKGRVADKVLGYIQDELKSHPEITATIADLKTIDLPFFDNEIMPSSPEYTITNENGIIWSNMVKDADAVLFITPEYNHTLTAIQKNAIDWLYGEWENKPIIVITYGWHGGVRALATLEIVLDNVKTKISSNVTQLYFMKDINPDGSLLNEENVRSQIAATLNEIS